MSSAARAAACTGTIRRPGSWSPRPVAGTRARWDRGLRAAPASWRCWPARSTWPRRCTPQRSRSRTRPGFLAGVSRNDRVDRTYHRERHQVIVQLKVGRPGQGPPGVGAEGGQEDGHAQEREGLGHEIIHGRCCLDRMPTGGGASRDVLKTSPSILLWPHPSASPVVESPGALLSGLCTTLGIKHRMDCRDEFWLSIALNVALSSGLCTT